MLVRPWTANDGTLRQRELGERRKESRTAEPKTRVQEKSEGVQRGAGRECKQ